MSARFDAARNPSLEVELSRPTGAYALGISGLGFALSGCLMASEPCEFSDSERDKVPVDGVEAYLVTQETAYPPNTEGIAGFRDACGDEVDAVVGRYVGSVDEALETIRLAAAPDCSEWRRFIAPLSLRTSTQADVRQAAVGGELKLEDRLWFGPKRENAIYEAVGCVLEREQESRPWIEFQPG